MGITVRGICGNCGRSEKLRVNGKLGHHDVRVDRGSHFEMVPCPGVGSVPQGYKPQPDPASPTGPQAVGGEQVPTQVYIVMDNSCSMARWREEAAAAFNNLVNPMRTEDTFTVRVAYFGDHFDPKGVYNAAKVPEMRAVYYGTGERGTLPFKGDGGWTALYDAMYNAMCYLNSQPENDAKLLLVITDGIENRSGITRSVLREHIEAFQATLRGTVSVACPPSQKSHMEDLGIPSGNILPWEQTAAGFEALNVRTTSAVGSYVQTRRSGEFTSTNFYQ